MHFWIDMIHNDSGYEPERIAKLGPKQGKSKVDQALKSKRDMFVDKAESLSPETFKKANEKTVQYVADSMSVKSFKDKNPRAKQMT
jgi:hypothetical protein